MPSPWVQLLPAFGVNSSFKVLLGHHGGEQVQEAGASSEIIWGVCQTAAVAEDSFEDPEEPESPWWPRE